MTKFYLIGFGIIGALMALIAIPVLQLYPYLTTDEDELAQYILDRGLPASNCMKLIHFDMMAPSVRDKRIGCVYKYAKKAKNPSACMLIMPSSYGMDCISDSIPPPICSIGYYMDILSSDFETTLAECVSGNTNIIRHPCCQVAKVAMIMDENDCSKLPSIEFRDECFYKKAFKNMNIEQCEEISNGVLRTACEIRTEALQKHPSLCENCAPKYKTARDVKADND